MEYLVGGFLALGVAWMARLVGFDRDRVFYPLILAVIASYYVLFAVMGGGGQVLALESAVAGAFLAVAVIGFKSNPWIIVAALAGHGLFDYTHHLFFENPGVPTWWPGFCLAFDVIAAACFAVLLIKRGDTPSGKTASG